MAQKDVNIKIKANSKEATSAIGKVTESLNSFNKKLDTNPVSRLTKSVGSLSVGFKAATAVIQKVGAAVKETTELYEKQAKAEKQLEVAARNNPYLNGSSVDRLKDYASQLQSISTMGDEELLPMMGRLAAAGRKESEIQDIMKAALDLSASGMMGMDQAVEALNASLQGNAGALAKQIPEIRNMTKEQLKNGEAIEVVKRNFAGMSEETAKATGSAQQLKNAIGDLKENIGKGFDAVITPVRRLFTGLIEDINQTVARARKAKVEMEAAAKIQLGTDNGDYGSDIYAAVVKARQSDMAAANSSFQATKADALGFSGMNEVKMNRFLQVVNTSGNIANEASVLADGDSILEQVLNELAAQKKKMQAVSAELDAATNKYKDALSREAQQVAEAELAALEADRKAAQSEALRSISDKKEILDIKKSAGQDMTEHEYWAEMYETAMSAYTSMLQSQAGDVTGMKTWDQRQLNSVAKKVSEYKTKMGQNPPPTASGSSSSAKPKTDADWIQDLLNSMEELEKEVEAYPQLHNGGQMSNEEVWKKRYDTAYKGLLDIFKNTSINDPVSLQDASDEAYGVYTQMLSDAKFLSDSDEWKGKKDELLKELDGIKEDVQLSLSDSIKIQIDQCQAMYDTLHDQANSFHQLSEQEEAAYNEKMAELAKQLREAQRTEFMEAVQEKVDLAQRIVSELGTSARQAAGMVTEYIENTTSAQTAEAKKQYEDGALSYEDYCDKVEDLDRKAAREKYKIAMADWAIQLAQATANIAQGVTKAIAEGGMMGIITGALVSAAGAVNIASIVASKPKPPSFAGGGIVPGNSYSGDRVQANVNSGEMVLNAKQQKALWAAANGNGAGGLSQQIIINNTMSDRADVSASADEGMIRIAVTEIVRSEMSRGSFTASMKEADAKSKGVRYL